MSIPPPPPPPPHPPPHPPSDCFINEQLIDKAVDQNRQLYENSLIVSLADFIRDNREIDIDRLKQNLDQFEDNIPEEFKLSATEAVNSTRARQLRNGYISSIVESSLVH